MNCFLSPSAGICFQKRRILCDVLCRSSICIRNYVSRANLGQPPGSLFGIISVGRANLQIEPKLRKSRTIVRRWGKYRQNFWVRGLIVGLLLTGQFHLFSAEIFHHHAEVQRVCEIEHQGGTYLHAGQPLTPLCPICQVVRNGSVRPAVQSSIHKPDQESTYQLIARQSRYSPDLTLLSLARGPPLS